MVCIIEIKCPKACTQKLCSVIGSKYGKIEYNENRKREKTRENYAHKFKHTSLFKVMPTSTFCIFLYIFALRSNINYRCVASLSHFLYKRSINHHTQSTFFISFHFKLFPLLCVVCFFSPICGIFREHKASGTLTHQYNQLNCK